MHPVPPAPPGCSNSRPRTLRSHASIRLHIAHPRRLFTQLLSRHLTQQGTCASVQVSHDQTAALRLLTTESPDLIVIGTDEAAFDGIALVNHLRKERARARILLTVPRLNDYLAHCATRLEVLGVLDESSADLDELGEAISTVAEGLRHRPSSTLRPSAVQQCAPAFHCLLSPRQEEVLRWIAHAKTDHEIAQGLGIKSSTAKRHRADVMRKLGASGSLSLIRRAQHLGFTSRPVP